MESQDCDALIRRSAELRARSARARKTSAEIVSVSRQLALQIALLLADTVHASGYGCGYGYGTAMTQARAAGGRNDGGPRARGAAGGPGRHR